VTSASRDGLAWAAWARWRCAGLSGWQAHRAAPQREGTLWVFGGGTSAARCWSSSSAESTIPPPWMARTSMATNTVANQARTPTRKSRTRRLKRSESHSANRRPTKETMWTRTKGGPHRWRVPPGYTEPHEGVCCLSDVRESLAFRIAWPILWLCWMPFAWLLFRQRARWVEPFPRKGPVLLLGNHVSFWDPLWVAWPVRRGVHYMASANLFRIPGVAWFVRLFGAFPKERFVKDKDSVLTLVQYYEAGLVLGLFPEGLRTWDGRPARVGDGIGRLIKRMDARVVYCRNLTGHLSQPRWARYPRWVPVDLEYSEPVTYPTEMTVEEITADVIERIRIDHVPEKVRGLKLGFRLAHGLPDFVWACPSCSALAALKVDPADGNRVICEGCEAAWEVTVLSSMKGVGDAPTLSVSAASDRAKEVVGLPPALDRARLAEEGVALEVDGARIQEIRGKGDLRPIAEGRLVLSTSGLAIQGANPWELNFDQMKVCFVDVGNQLQIRTHDDLLLVRPGGQSPLLWEHFIETWRQQEA
jgi:1-acyl-sn-glycerol-3-phosphate acyltransferase